jgi:hypothetical protein
LSGEASTSGLFELIKGSSSETNYLVWSQILGSLGTVKSVFADDAAITEGIQNFTVKLIGPALERVGWEISPGDDLLTSQLRADLILTGGMNCHKE